LRGKLWPDSHTISDSYNFTDAHRTASDTYGIGYADRSNPYSKPYTDRSNPYSKPYTDSGSFGRRWLPR
jgi:hypothetical protein